MITQLALAILSSLAQVSPNVPLVLLLVSVLLFFFTTRLNTILSAPYRLALRMLRRTGIYSDRRTWGVVYDAVSKDPIDPAYVTVRGRLGTIVGSAITDLDGRFGIIVPPGTYTLSVEKTHYAFPSKQLVGKQTDGYYTGLYFGGRFDVTSSERALAFAVPMDPLEKDWNQDEKKRTHLNPTNHREFRSSAYTYFLIAGIFVIAQYISIKNAFAIELFKLYIAMVAAGIVYIFLKPAAYYHSVVLSSGQPLGFARIKVFAQSTKVQVASKITSFNGQFTCLVPNGLYYVTIEARTDTGQYVLVHTSPAFRVVDRSIARKFLV